MVLVGVPSSFILLCELVAPNVREQQGISSGLRIPLLPHIATELSAASLVTTVLWVDPHAMLISMANRDNLAASKGA